MVLYLQDKKRASESLSLAHRAKKKVSTTVGGREVDQTEDFRTEEKKRTM
jgi:hypothetical protein